MEKKVFSVTKFQLAWGLHIVLTSLALLAWGPPGYFFINLIFQGSLFFIYLQPKDIEPLVIGSLLNAFCVIFETVCIGVTWPSAGSAAIFSAVVAIINVVARFFTAFTFYLAYKNLKGETPQVQVVVQ